MKEAKAAGEEVTAAKIKKKSDLIQWFYFAYFTAEC